MISKMSLTYSNKIFFINLSKRTQFSRKFNKFFTSKSEREQRRQILKMGKLAEIIK